MVIILIALKKLMHSSSFSFAAHTTEMDLVFAAGVLAAYAFRGSRFTALLRLPSARFFADTSYCVYLIHLSLLALVDRWHFIATLSPLWAGLLRGACAYPLTFALAALSRKVPLSYPSSASRPS